MNNKGLTQEYCISIFIRVTVALLFGIMSLSKFVYGLDKSVLYFQALFEPTWLPQWAVTIFAKIIPFVEIVIFGWLLSGVALKQAWIFTCIIMLSLTFGMTVAKGYNTPANNFIYLGYCLVGLYFSKFDGKK